MNFNPDWEEHAESWITWARTPGHDEYWSYRDAFFALVPPAGRATLDIGCGEGRVARDLASRGHRVVGVDASPTLVRAAAEADPDGQYLVADAAALPFEDASFDLVVSYNALMDVQDMPAAVHESARVLTPGGRLCICVVHPIADLTAFEHNYFERSRFDGTMERDGLTMTFRGWSYPLDAYTRAFEDAGLVIEALREPPAAAGPWQRLPLFLMLRMFKVGPHDC